MNVSDAIKSRMTVRQFLDKPVPLETLREILEISKRAPSGGNLQPWTVHAITGEALKSLVRDVEEKMKAGVTEEPEYNVYPPDLIEPYRTRRRIVGQQLYDLIGVPRSDTPGKLKLRCAGRAVLRPAPADGDRPVCGCRYVHGEYHAAGP